MNTAGTTIIPEIWWSFLVETELMKNIKKAHYLSGHHSPAPDPIGDRIIPSLSYLRIGSILDEALEEYIDSNIISTTTSPTEIQAHSHDTAAFTIAAMPALIASGSMGQASMRVANAGSIVAGAPDLAPPAEESAVFTDFSRGVRIPPPPLLTARHPRSAAESPPPP
jgi:hypothetical protein